MFKNIVVIEDSAEQRDAVGAMLLKEQSEGNIDGFWIMKDYKEFQSFFNPSSFNYAWEGMEDFAVMTDLFFPMMPEDDVRKPLGALIMARCQKQGIPCVIVTSQYHHDDELNWVCELGRTLDWPEMFDNTDMEIIGKKEPNDWGYCAPILSNIKAWGVAYKYLKETSGGA